MSVRVTKVCTKCNIDKPRGDYYTIHKGGNAIQSQCKKCAVQTRVKYPIGKYRAKAVLRSIRSRLKQYGLTPAQYDALFQKQDGKCKVCRLAPTHRLHVDHCHKTGIVRGLLCNGCNGGLGMFKDDPGLLRKAIEYLEAS